MHRPLLPRFSRCRDAARPVVLVFLMCCLLLPAGLPAATVDGLFEAEVPVQGRDTAQRNQAIQEALGQVLVKVSGYPDIPARPELAGELAQAPLYVQQYRYLASEQSGEQPPERLPLPDPVPAGNRAMRRGGAGAHGP